MQQNQQALQQMQQAGVLGGQTQGQKGVTPDALIKMMMLQNAMKVPDKNAQPQDIANKIMNLIAMGGSGAFGDLSGLKNMLGGMGKSSNIIDPMTGAIALPPDVGPNGKMLPPMNTTNEQALQQMQAGGLF